MNIIRLNNCLNNKYIARLLNTLNSITCVCGVSVRCKVGHK